MENIWYLDCVFVYFFYFSSIVLLASIWSRDAPKSFLGSTSNTKNRLCR
jgi:hypothetical protein